MARGVLSWAGNQARPVASSMREGATTAGRAIGQGVMVGGERPTTVRETRKRARAHTHTHTHALAPRRNLMNRLLNAAAVDSSGRCCSGCWCRWSRTDGRRRGGRCRDGGSGGGHSHVWSHRWMGDRKGMGQIQPIARPPARTHIHTHKHTSTQAHKHTNTNTHPSRHFDNASLTFSAPSKTGRAGRRCRL